METVNAERAEIEKAEQTAAAEKQAIWAAQKAADDALLEELREASIGGATSGDAASSVARNNSPLPRSSPLDEIRSRLEQKIADLKTWAQDQTVTVQLVLRQDLGPVDSPTEAYGIHNASELIGPLRR